MAEAKHPFGGGVAARRPALRSDLKFVYDASEAADGSVRVVDPRSGRQYSFDKREHFLCRAADGSADIATLQARLEAEAGGGMTEAEVTKFFRRLHILGFLQPEAPEPAAPSEPAASRPESDAARDLLARRRQEMADKAAAPQPSRDPGAARDLLARRRQEMEDRPAPGAAGSEAGAGPRGGGLMARRRQQQNAAPAPAETAGGARGRLGAAGRRLQAPVAGAADQARDLMARRRQERAGQETPPTAETPQAPPPPQAPPRDPSAARDLMARRRQERAAGPVAPPPGPGPQPEPAPEPVAERPEATPAAPPMPVAPAMAEAVPEAPEAQMPVLDEATEPAPATLPAEDEDDGDLEFVFRDDEGAEDPADPDGPDMVDIARSLMAGPPRPAPVDAASPVPEDPAQDPEDTGEAGSVPTAEAPADPMPVEPAQAAPARVEPAPVEPAPAEAPAVAATPEVPDEAAAAARAAMASAQDAVSRAAPPGETAAEPLSPAAQPAPAARDGAVAAQKAAAAIPSARPVAQKAAPRSSDLMARRLRERANRGHAPETGKPSDPIDPAPGTAAAGPVSPAPDGGGLDFDFLQDDFDDAGPGGGPGGGMGGGMGGMRGGMMGGGMGGMMGGMGGMRGGMMGGGGGPGGGMGGMMGGMGGMRGGMMGGGGGPGGGMGGMMGGMGGMRGGMMGGMQQKKPKKKMPGQLPFFDPQGFLRLLYVLFYPLKYVLWVLLPLAVLAAFTMFNNFAAMIADFGVVTSDFSYAAQFFMAMFGISLVARTAQGVAIVAHGGRVGMFGMALVLGFIPRFVIDRSDIENLDRQGQLWSYGTPLLARLALFSLGTLIWALTRDNGGTLHYAVLIFAQMGLTMFLITSWPMFVSDGQRWTAVMLNEPKLMGKSVMALKALIKGGDVPPMLSKKDIWPLALFAIGTILSVSLFLIIVVTAALTLLVGEYNGLGLMLFLGCLSAFVMWILSLRAQGKRNNKRGGFDKAAFKEMARARRPDFVAEPEDEEERAEAVMPSRAKVIWSIVLFVLLGIAFLPYEYETGGEVEILPMARGQAVARTDGEIVEVLVREGTTVARGQVVARLSSWDQEANIRETEVQLAGSRAELAKLIAGATPEEIEVSRKKLDSAEASVAFKRAEAERNRALAATGVVSQAALEKALSDLEVDLADLEVARADYNKTVAPATAEELAIARADVERLEAQLAFERDELERTKIVAPLEGQVVTPDLNLRMGSFLRSGDVLLEIEETDIVTATILVTETDIGLIALDDTVRLKVTGQSDREILGSVEAIAPSASEEDGMGRGIRVTAEFQNDDGFLRSGMTGYAKIDGEEMRVWEAYLRSIRHFFQIEVWSWIP